MDDVNLKWYQDKWEEDAHFELDKLDEAARNVPLLHARWWKFYSSERLRLRKIEMEFKRLERLRWEYWLGKLDDETREAQGWPPQPLKILQTNVDRYLTADDVLEEHHKRVIMAEETVKFLEDVIKNINRRGYDISNAINYLRFKMGQ